MPWPRRCVGSWHAGCCLVPYWQSVEVTSRPIDRHIQASRPMRNPPASSTSMNQRLPSGPAASPLGATLGGGPLLVELDACAHSVMLPVIAVCGVEDVVHPSKSRGGRPARVKVSKGRCCGHCCLATRLRRFGPRWWITISFSQAGNVAETTTLPR